MNNTELKQNNKPTNLSELKFSYEGIIGKLEYDFDVFVFRHNLGTLPWPDLDKLIIIE